MDKFENIIKQTVESYEAPYDAQAWANVSAQLGNKGGGAMKWVIGSAAVVVLITGTVYLMQNEKTSPAENVLTENTIQPTEDVNLNSDVTEPVNEENETANIVNDTDQESNTASDRPVINHNPVVINPVVSGNPGGQTGNNQTTTTVTNTNNQVDPVVNPGTNSSDPVVSNTVKVNSRFQSSSNMACMTSEFIFTPEDANQNVTYVWEFGDGTFSNTKIASHTYNRAGTFSVTLSLKDVKTNKTLSKSAVEVVVNPIPVVNFAWEQSNNLIPTISFINLTEDAQNFGWDVKGLKTSTETQIDYTFRKKGTYIVELTAGNEFGCTNSIQKPIEVKTDYNLLAPTAFTPNGDNRNDYFIPEALRIMNVEFTMVIYDKSGSMMYQTNDVNLPWDGVNVNDNSQASDGAYIWKVQFRNTKGELEMYEGQVIITR